MNCIALLLSLHLGFGVASALCFSLVAGRSLALHFLLVVALPPPLPATHFQKKKKLCLKIFCFQKKDLLLRPLEYLVLLEGDDALLWDTEDLPLQAEEHPLLPEEEYHRLPEVTAQEDILLREEADIPSSRNKSSSSRQGVYS